ncbi:MAG: CorA family divalent cation transporter [bacterium]|nr:CorA family divalent cation transporter [bacterium]
MMYRQGYRGGVWVDLEGPTNEEIRQVVDEFSISERVEAELLSPTPFPLVSSDQGMALVVLHFPVHRTGNEDIEGDTRSQEVDFIVGKRFVVTVRYEVVAPLHRLRKLLESEELVSGSASVTTDVLVEILFAHLYAAVRDHGNHVADRLARIERDMFAGSERLTVRAISEVNREYLHLESALANQEEPVTRFLTALSRTEFFGESFTERRTRVLNERAQVAGLIHTHRAIAAELRETNNALLNAKQNEIIKILTVVNFIFLPLGLISWTFAMRTEGMPIIDRPDAFWIVIGGMLAVALCLTFFFTKKRWLF